MWITSVGVENPGGKYNSGFRNPYAEMARGYQSQFESTVMANLKFEQKLDFITEGLSAELCSRSKTGVVLTPIVRPVTISFR